MVEEDDLLSRRMKKVKQGENGFTRDQFGIKAYDDEDLKEAREIEAKKFKSYKDTLVGGEGFEFGFQQGNLTLDDGSEQAKGQDMEGEEEFSKFSILEEINGGKPCPNFFILKQEED